MKPLALPLEALKARYDVVVVGSGYGGAVAAARLARAGRRVAVLERGREFAPGDFPDTPMEAAGELRLHLPEGTSVGPSEALFDIHMGKEMHVLVGCGLGGTSLINAAVALRPDPRVFSDPCWPAALRADLDAGLEVGFGRALSGLGAAPYPDGRPKPAKLAALETSARAAGRPCVRPPIAISFAGERACDDCGDCVAGCNRNAKNSTDTNYLPDAHRHGAEIFCSARVSHLERSGSGWRVLFAPLDDGRDAFDAPPLAVEAEVVVLAAGSLGSSEILLRSRERGLPLSDQVGRRFTGNGDAVGFGYNLDVPVNGVGSGSRVAKPPVGPCITGVLDGRDPDEPLELGLVIEEGALPAAMAPLLPAVFAAGAAALGHDTDEGVSDAVRELGRETQSLLLGPYRGAVNHSQTFLVMGHDDAGGRLELAGDRVVLRWPGVGQQPVFRRIDTALRDATAALGGTYIRNPLWNGLLGEQLITVHPLGGCPMGEDERSGAVDHAGQLFDGAGGLHHGLYVCDGAILPRSLGCNPLLTITALAERNMALLAQRHGWHIDYEGQGQSLDRAAAEPRLAFTETMRGHLALDADLDYRAAEAVGERAGGTVEFTVTVVAADLEAFLSAPGGTARLYGTLTAPDLSPQPLTVTGGAFRLFGGDPDRVGTRRMEYRMPLTAADGTAYLLTGFKLIHDDGGLDLWADTTTLYVDLMAADGRRIGRGVLHIELADFARQLATLRVTGAAGRERLAWLTRFGRLFAGTLYDVYGGIFARPGAFDPGAPPRKRRPLRAPLPEVVPLRASDGVRLRLTRYRGSGTPVLLLHGLGNSSRIFSLDTVDTNLVEYLTAAGHDLWLLDSRASIELPAVAGEFDGDALALFDYPAAIQAVCAATGAAVDVVAHGFGALTAAAALLSGMAGVRSLLCAQAALHLNVPTTTRLKTRIPALLDALGIDHLTAYTDQRAGWLDKLLNAGLRLQPVAADERCRNPVCHRITFIYGLAYEHDKLNSATHDTLHELFGATSIQALDHLARIVRAGRLLDAGGNDRYLPHLERLALPITLLHGSENGTLLPEGTERSLALLGADNPPELYRRHLLPGYGHLDCLIGKDAARDVFPLIAEHLARAAAAVPDLATVG